MRSTRRWFLFVATYTFGFGAALLLIPHRLPSVFEPNEEMWVRIFGMLLIGISILQYELFRSGRSFMLRAGLIHQCAAALLLGYVVAFRDAAWLRLPLIVVIIGLIGGGISYLQEAKDAPAPGPDFVLLRKTALWNLYVSSYTLAFGVLGAFLPGLIFPLLGFTGTDGAWVHAAGFAFLVLCHFNYEVYRAKGSARYIFAIYLLRCFVLGVLLVMTASGFPLGLLVPVVVLSIGVVGTTIFYFPEMRRVRGTVTS